MINKKTHKINLRLLYMGRCHCQKSSLQFAKRFAISQFCHQANGKLITKRFGTSWQKFIIRCENNNKKIVALQFWSRGLYIA